MTWKEIQKVPFHMVSHLAMEDEHRSTYADNSGRLGFCDVVPMRLGNVVGKGYRVYRIDSTWYDDVKEFKKALKKFGFGPQLPKQ